MSETISFERGSCAVCGSTPTVKSHIIPRALAHDLRGDGKHLVSGEIDRPGIRYLQSGRWDGYILCGVHEGRLTRYDDYGVEFIRNFRNLPSVFKRGDHFALTNSSPADLQRFLLAVIWRKNLSNQARGQPCGLGPYAQAISNTLFAGEEIESPALTFQSVIAIDGERTPIATEPYKVKLAGFNAWYCGFGWLDAVVKLDKRNWPPEWQPYDATKNNVARVVGMNPRNIQDIPSLSPILKQMKSQQRSRKLG